MRLAPAAAGRLVAALAVVATLAALGSAAAQRPRIQKATVEVFTDRASYAPGSQARLVARLAIDDGWHVQSHTPSFDYLIPTELEIAAPPGWSVGSPRYPAHVFWTAEFEDEPLAVYEGEVSIFADLDLPADAVPGAAAVEAKVRYQACDDRQCLPPTEAVAKVEVAVGDEGPLQHAALFDSGAGPAAGSSMGLGPVLLLGLLGGLILNVMPCVLPVLSLKLIALLQKAGKDRRAVVAGSLATTAGILVSFWALAAIAIGARAAGELIGWGIQFQNPTFVTFLALVVVLFSLNLWGLFEVPLPAALARAGATADHKGLAGHFATGLFATLMATPCSAPFLGTAVGFGLSQSGGMIVATFTAIGLGLALPYLALAAFPGSLSWLPKPGPWMVQLRAAMGFLLAGAAVWLLYVLASQLPLERVAFIEGGLLLVALFVWLDRSARAADGGVLAKVGVAAAVVATLWLSTGATAPASAGPGESTGRIVWTDFDPARATELAEGGTLVFLDVTADWCFTCKANERLVLETDEVVAAFEEHGVVPMKADWTNRNEEIAGLLARHGRYSIPFYLLYRPGAEPHLFPELLTKRAVVEALEASSSRTASVGG
ncbi:MAG: thioredoxin family protein [Thermoanaerobaculia bacterium]|nr:thioredoxin family protein [Thermoanaerobaculia bacterium]